MPPIIPQIIGIIAVITYLSSYQIKHRKGIIISNVISRVLYILQYLLLGAFSGAVLDVLGAVASVLAERSDRPFIKKHRRTVIIASNVAIVGAGLAVCIISKNPLDLLPIVGVVLQVGAFWFSDERKIRIVSLIGTPFWFIYNLASRAYGSSIGDVFTMLSIIIAMIKYRKKAEKAN